MKLIEIIHYENTITHNTDLISQEQFIKYLDTLNNQKDIGLLYYTRQNITRKGKVIGSLIEVYI